MSNSRMNRYEKRRKNTQTLNILLFIGALLIILLILMYTFTKNDQEDNTREKGNNQNLVEEGKGHQVNNNIENNNKDSNQSENNEQVDEDENKNEDDNPSNDSSEGITTILPSEDENVISAFTKDWAPIGTEQKEPHVMQFNKESQDWIEMERALKVATELDDLIIWWLGNDGDQKAVGTVTSLDQTEIYRVYISWIENEGWQPTKVEVLLENDKRRD